ncbi:unnamed protein product [Rotaria sordida]|uniref:Uncharacterized protein n=1 Tax=Rotaria sordida TaxID=392033 RepID=A0A813WZY9_9BILA|nr:unnamed protein product [Rotaria sordida]CAF3609787.1 unnamed protein product [Rotaria sordida]
MSNIISLYYLFQFVIFLYIIPIYITIETTIKIVFLNGLNVIRCSDHQVQVYKLPYYTGVTFNSIITCDTKDEIYSPQYTGFKWGKLKLICSSHGTKVQEEQVIIKSKNGDIQDIPSAKGQLGQSTELYELIVKSSLISDTRIVSREQPADDAYFYENTTPKERRIYIWFPDHPIICRIIFTGDENNPCPSMHNQEIDDVDYACYYNPGADGLPTKEQMEAELKQIEETDDKPTTVAAYFRMYIRTPSRRKRKDNTSIDSAEIYDDELNDQTNNSSYHNTPHPINSSKSKEKHDILKIIGLIFGIILLIGLIGGVSYFLIRKHYFKKSSSSTMNIENDGKDSYSLSTNQSQQSLTVTSTNETNTHVPMNVSPQEEQTFARLQPPDRNKRQRTDTSMIFNEDM